MSFAFSVHKDKTQPFKKRCGLNNVKTINNTDLSDACRWHETAFQTLLLLHMDMYNARPRSINDNDSDNAGDGA